MLHANRPAGLARAMTTSAIARPQNLVIESLKETPAAQASHLIDQYQAEIEPPKPPETACCPVSVSEPFLNA